MNAQDRKDMAEFTAALKLEFAAQLQPLVDKIIELDQRSSNFAARVSSHNQCYRSEIQALREEVTQLKAGKVFVASAPRISTEAWDAAMAELRLRHPGQSYFTPAQVRSVAHSAQTVVVAEDEYSL